MINILAVANLSQEDKMKLLNILGKSSFCDLEDWTSSINDNNSAEAQAASQFTLMMGPFIEALN